MSKTPEVKKEKVAIDPIHARLDAMQEAFDTKSEEQSKIINEQAKQIQELSARRASDSDDEDDGILVDRKSAHTMSLPVIDGAPVISAKLKRVVGVPGLEYIMEVETAAEKSYKIPMGADLGSLDFTNAKLEGVEAMTYQGLSQKKFELQDIDENDLTGASKVERGKIVSEGNVIPEIDRSSGRPVMTGRKIRTVVRSDVRYYTIEHDGKKFTLSSTDLANIRI